MDRPFDRLKDCIKCHREIDEVEVRLKRLTIGPDTYRRTGMEKDPAFKYEKLCTDCHDGRVIPTKG